MRKPLGSWYEAQYLASDGVWTVWEKFPYDTSMGNPRVLQFGARTRAIKAAHWCLDTVKRPVRVIHCSAAETYAAA